MICSSTSDRHKQHPNKQLTQATHKALNPVVQHSNQPGFRDPPPFPLLRSSLAQVWYSTQDGVSTDVLLFSRCIRMCSKNCQSSTLYSGNDRIACVTRAFSSSMSIAHRPFPPRFYGLGLMQSGPIHAHSSNVLLPLHPELLHFIAMGFLKKFDFYRQVPSDLTEPTTPGAVISITCGIAMLFLLVSELVSFLSLAEKSEMFVQQEEGGKLRLHFNMTFPKMPCCVYSLDVLDIMGRHEVPHMRPIPMALCHFCSMCPVPVQAMRTPTLVAHCWESVP